MELRTVKSKSEQIQAIELSKSIFKENMAEQFTSLFGEANWGHMFIAIDVNQIVSLVNYYSSIVHIGPCQINVASIGSVCTKAEYRGQKLATKLLLLAEKQMKQENIDLVIISGAGGIYTDFGSSLAGNVFEYCINQEKLIDKDSVHVVKYEQNKLLNLISIQKKETVRYHRTEEEFSRLLSAQTFPDTFATYPIYLLEKDNTTLAYIVGIIPVEGDEFGIKEFAGDRRTIVDSFRTLVKLHQRDKIHFAADDHDPINQFLSQYERKLIHQHASFKIIDFCDLMEKLKPYFESIVPNFGMEFQLIDNTAVFRINHEIYEVHSSELLSKIILGFDQPVLLQLDNQPNIKEFFNQVFPIPFVWTNNINYQ